MPIATAAVDPDDPPTWTGTWRDPAKSPPADGGRPENSLTGTLFMVNGPGTDNPGTLSIQVPADYGPMRFWRNTSIENLAQGKTASLPAGTLGYEWDADVDNGSRPAGTFDLSSTTVNLTSDLLLDEGGIYGAGTAIHQMTEYRAPSGALVFGAGTIQWAWGLDANHDNSFEGTNLRLIRTCNRRRQIYLLTWECCPTTLPPGLVMPSKSTDTTPPISTITSPKSGAVFQFGIPATVTGTAIDTGGGVVAGVEVSGDGGQTWHRATGRASWSYSWTPMTAGSVTLLSRAVDDSANLEIPSPGVDVTVPSPPISTDAAVSTDGTSASTTIESPSFSTTVNNELLLAFVTADYTAGANTTVTSMTGGGLTWTLVVRSNGQSGDSEIWRAFATSPISAATVTASLSQSVVSSITIRSFEGVNTSGTNGSGAIGATASANAKTGAPSASVTTTQNASWVYGVGNDFDSATPAYTWFGAIAGAPRLNAGGRHLLGANAKRPDLQCGHERSYQRHCTHNRQMESGGSRDSSGAYWNTQHFGQHLANCRWSGSFGSSYGRGYHNSNSECVGQLYVCGVAEWFLCGDAEPGWICVHSEFDITHPLRYQRHRNQFHRVSDIRCLRYQSRPRRAEYW